MIYRLEMRSTENWSDVLYRDYTSSAARARRFCELPKIQFTDSGHGIVSVVTEARSRGRDKIMAVADHVREHGAHK